MKIDQQIFAELLNNAGGNQSKIKGLSQMTLIQMKRGEAKTSFSKLFEVLFENGIEKISLFSKETRMDFDVIDKEVVVTTRRIKELEVVK